MSQPPYRHVIKHADGRTIICEPREARRVVDRRRNEDPSTVWEIVDHTGRVTERLWPEDVLSWDLEALTPTKELKAEEA